MYVKIKLKSTAGEPEEKVDKEKDCLHRVITVSDRMEEVVKPLVCHPSPHEYRG
jgi:hypothetical protein